MSQTFKVNRAVKAALEILGALPAHRFGLTEGERYKLATVIQDCKDAIEPHNGWPNYETWALNLWLSNDADSTAQWEDAARDCIAQAHKMHQVTERTWTESEAAIFRLADLMKESTEANSPLPDAGLYTDLLSSAMQEIDWNYIAEHFIEAVTEERDKRGVNPRDSDIIEQPL